MLTPDEVRFLYALIDAGIKAAGVQVFNNGGGLTMNGILEKFGEMEKAPPPAPPPADEQKDEA